MFKERSLKPKLQTCTYNKATVPNQCPNNFQENLYFHAAETPADFAQKVAIQSKKLEKYVAHFLSF